MTLEIADYMDSPDMIMARAAEICSTLPTKDAKVAAVGAACTLAGEKLATVIFTGLQDSLAEQQAIAGYRIDTADDAVWQTELDDTARNNMADIRAGVGLALWGELVSGIRLDEPGMLDAVADAVAARVQQEWQSKVLPMHRGKWLAKFGIAAEQLKQIETDAKAYAETGHLSARGEPTEAEVAALGLSPVAPPPAAPGLPEALPAFAQTPPTPPSKPPSAAEVKGAYKNWGKIPDFAGMAKKLGCSQQTLKNWVAGKPSKCGGAQAQALAGDIAARIEQLQAAYAVFARIQ